MTPEQQAEHIKEIMDSMNRGYVPVADFTATVEFLIQKIHANTLMCDEMKIEHIKELNKLSDKILQESDRIQKDSTAKDIQLRRLISELEVAINDIQFIPGEQGEQGVPGKDGIDGKDGSPDTPDQVVDKVNRSSKLIRLDKVDGLKDIPSAKEFADVKRMAQANAYANQLPVTTSFFNGLRGKNLTIIGGSAVQRGDTVVVTMPNSSGGQVDSVVAGTGISVDNTDPANPIVSVTGSSTGFQQPTSGSVDGSNQIFTWAVEPNAIVIDGVPKQKVSSDGTVNWTGTTTTTLAVAPNNDVFAIA